MIYDMIHLTPIGLTPGGSSTYLHTNNTEQHNIDAKQYIEQHNSQLREMRTVPRLCDVHPGICRTTEEKARKNLSQGSRNLSKGKSIEQWKMNMRCVLKNRHPRSSRIFFYLVRPLCPKTWSSVFLKKHGSYCNLIKSKSKQYGSRLYLLLWNRNSKFYV